MVKTRTLRVGRKRNACAAGRPHVAGQPGTRGFSLVEVLAVVAILAVIAGLTARHYGTATRGAELDAATLNTAALLRAARTRAVLQRDSGHVSIDVENGVIWEDKSASRVKLPDGTRLSVASARTEQRSKSVAGVRFYPNGSSSGATVRFVRGAQSSEVRVNWLSGRVTSRVRSNGY